MPPRFSGILSSRPFEIQSSDTSFFIHGDTLAEKWRSLYTSAIDEGYKIDLSDWDSDTVGLFAEFLYTGDYKVPGSISERGEEAEVQEGRDGVNILDMAQSPAVGRGWMPGPDVNLLLVHARVYALAQYKDVKPLQEIAFGWLRTTLGGIDGSMMRETPAVAVNVIELLTYVYSHADSNPRMPERPMRELVSKFAVRNIEPLMTQRGEMARLLSKGGDLMIKLMEGVTARLSHADEVRFHGMERVAHDWMDRAAALGDKVRQLGDINAKIRQSEASSAEKVQQLEAKVRQTESKVRQTEATIRQMEASSAEKVQQLEAKVRQTEAKVRQTEATIRQTEATTRQMEASSAEKVQQLEAKVRQTEAKVRQMEARNTTEIQQLGATYAQEMRRLEARNTTEIQQLRTTHAQEVLRLEASNTAEIRRLVATNSASTKLLEDKNKKRVYEALKLAKIYCFFAVISVVVAICVVSQA